MKVWWDAEARDTGRGRWRYAHPFHRANARLAGCGYNLVNLGGP